MRSVQSRKQVLRVVMQRRLSADGVARCVCYGDAGRSSARDDGGGEILVDGTSRTGWHIGRDVDARERHSAIFIISIARLNHAGQNVIPIYPVAEDRVATGFDSRDCV